MDIKEAKGIVDGDKHTDQSWWKAKGFLEGHEACKKEMIDKFAPVVEALGRQDQMGLSIAVKEELVNYRRTVLEEMP